MFWVSNAASIWGRLLFGGGVYSSKYGNTAIEGQTKETFEPSTDQKPKGVAVSNIPKLVDNKWRHMEKTLPSTYTTSFQAFLGQCISVTYPRRTAGRRLDNLGVRMREHFCIFEKFTRSTEIIYK